MTTHLSDDGTLDTVFECDECGIELRYSSEGIERTEDGDLAEGELARVAEEHAEECGDFCLDCGERLLDGIDYKDALGFIDYETCLECRKAAEADKPTYLREGF